MIRKTIQRSEECFVQFTKEELEQLNIKEGDKFTWEVQDDGLMLKKFGTIDIDFADFDREVLEFLIAESCEKDVSVNEIISDILQKTVDSYK
jgi:bifunctional DNA-binding transcriptional regulator/antitoxin component of YhaV-PrlF toxin-antitoxin module